MNGVPRSGSGDVTKVIGASEEESANPDTIITPVDLVCRICEERVRADLLEGHTEFCLQCMPCREGGELTLRLEQLQALVRERIAEGKDLNHEADRLPVSFVCMFFVLMTYV